MDNQDKAKPRMIIGWRQTEATTAKVRNRKSPSAKPAAAKPVDAKSEQHETEAA